MHNLATPPPPLLRTGIPRPASLPAPPRRARDQTRHHGIPTDHRPRSPIVLASAATDQQMSLSIEPQRVPVVQPCRSCITVPDPAKRTHTAVFPCTKTTHRLHAGLTACACSLLRVLRHDESCASCVHVCSRCALAEREAYRPHPSGPDGTMERRHDRKPPIIT